MDPKPETKKCERCRQPGGLVSMDYCAVCSKNLCNSCMQNGCCGNIPAKSGMEADYGPEADAIIADNL